MQSSPYELILQIYLSLPTDSLMFTLKFINLYLEIHGITVQNQNPEHKKNKTKFIDVHLKIH